jgi:hypothetical protein
MPISRPARAMTHTRGTPGTLRRDTLVAAALAYAERGWRVFPLRPDDKRPAFPAHPETACHATDPRCVRAGRHVSWEERATTDPARIRTAWTAAPYGIGIACGPSGLVVVDLDTPKPDRHGILPTPPPGWDHPGIRDGADVFDELCAANGPFRMWDTYSVHTGRDGLHLYFTHPITGPHLRNTAGDLGWLIDTRAHGGYVVAAPSTVAGRPYECDDPDAAVSPLPLWLTKDLSPKPLPPQRPVPVALRAVSGVGADARRDAYLAAAIDRQVETILTAGEGARNRALYQSAAALGQLAAGGELHPDTVTQILESAAERAGLTRLETTRTISSGMRAGAKRPRTLTTGSEIAA